MIPNSLYKRKPFVMYYISLNERLFLCVFSRSLIFVSFNTEFLSLISLISMFHVLFYVSLKHIIYWFLLLSISKSLRSTTEKIAQNQVIVTKKYISKIDYLGNPIRPYKAKICSGRFIFQLWSALGLCDMLNSVESRLLI